MIENMNTKEDTKTLHQKTWGSGLLVVLIFILGVYAGGGTLPQLLGATHSTQEITSDDAFAIFNRTWNELESRYNFENTPTVEERIFAATQGLARAYNDPHTVFFPPQETESFGEDIGGAFGGVGMEVGFRNGFITVIAPLRESPAEAAGILAGDIILEVDGEDITQMSLDSVIRSIRGEIGTEVTLGVFREGEELLRHITIERDTIVVPIIDTDFDESSGVFTIALYSFNERAPRAFQDAIQEFNDSGSDKLILDLRGNPGGFLSGAIDIASWFVPEGRIIVTESFGEESEKRPVHYRSKGYQLLNQDIDIVVLINRGSASASEIVAGALSEHGRATLIGETTFGKGSVQEYILLEQGASLKVTVAKWLTPDGRVFNTKGIEPDIDVSLSVEDFAEDMDTQWEAARDYLLDN